MTVVVLNRTNDLVRTVQVREQDGNDTTIIRSYYENEMGTFFDRYCMLYWEALAICWPLALVYSLLLTGDKCQQVQLLTPDGNNC